MLPFPDALHVKEENLSLTLAPPQGAGIETFDSELRCWKTLTERWCRRTNIDHSIWVARIYWLPATNRCLFFCPGGYFERIFVIHVRLRVCSRFMWSSANGRSKYSAIDRNSHCYSGYKRYSSSNPECRTLTDSTDTPASRGFSCSRS